MTATVIVSTARTPLAESCRGAFNTPTGATLGGHAAGAAVERAGIELAEVDDVIIGDATAEGATGGNIARPIALLAGLPVWTCTGGTRQRHTVRAAVRPHGVGADPARRRAVRRAALAAAPFGHAAAHGTLAAARHPFLYQLPTVPEWPRVVDTGDDTRRAVQEGWC